MVEGKVIRQRLSALLARWRLAWLSREGEEYRFREKVKLKE